MDIQSRPFRRAAAAARKRAQAYLRTATVTDGTAGPISEAGMYVARHPESAVWTAFGFGLLLGAAAGWMAAQRHELNWHGRFDDYVGTLRRRFHW